jgi:ParB/RepB/Spo0J family partition protein
VADECRNIPLSQLHEPWPIMRPVIRDSIEFLERKDSIARHGPLNSLLVRPSTRQPGKFEIIDGMWRYSASLEIGREDYPCIIKLGLSDDDALAMQLQANAVRADTTPTEYSRQLRRIIQTRKGMTASELARIAGKHPAWVKERLNLLEMAKDMQLMVDRGEISISNGYMLAKIPRIWRRKYVDHARVMSGPEFKALAAAVIKQYTECVQKGKMDERYLPEFTPQHYLRGVKEVKAELENPQVGATIMAADNCKTLPDAWNSCLRWALHLDRQSIEEQQRKATQRNEVKFQKEVEASHEALGETLDD